MQNTVLRRRLCAFSLPVFNAQNANFVLVVIRCNPAIGPSVVRRVLTAGLGAETRWHLNVFQGRPSGNAADFPPLITCTVVLTALTASVFDPALFWPHSKEIYVV